MFIGTFGEIFTVLGKSAGRARSSRSCQKTIPVSIYDI